MGNLFKSIEPINSPTPVDITSKIDQITQDTMIKLILGAPLGDPDLFNRWFSVSVKVIQNLDPNYGSLNATYIERYEEMMNFVRSTPVGKTLGRSKNKDLFQKEAMFFTMWLATGGVVAGQRASLRFLTDLSASDRKLIQDEADGFHRCLKRGHKFNNCFVRTKFIDQFVMEVLRLETPVANVRGRAIKDFVLTSLNGRYQIKKGDWLIGNVLSAQRDPEFFKNHSSFDMHRSQRNTKENFFTFGGPYYQKPTPTNHKCIGQRLAISFMKMFILHFTQCDAKLGPLVQSPSKTSRVQINASKFSCRL